MAAFALMEICRAHAENQDAVADFGGVSQLVVLMKSSSEDVRGETAGAIWALSDGNEAIKVTRAPSAHAHARLHRHLRASACPLSRVRHARVQVSIAAAGGIAPLVSLLATGGRRGQEHATYALAALGLANVDNQSQITALLVGVLSTGSPEAMSNAAASLWHLVQENAASREQIARAGSAVDLIHLLKKGAEQAKDYALWSLSLSIDAGNQQTVRALLNANE